MNRTVMNSSKSGISISQLGCGNYAEEIEDYKTVLDLLQLNDLIKKPDNKDNEIFYQSIVTYPEFLLIALARFFKQIGSHIVVSLSKEKWDEEQKKHKLLEEFGFGEKKLILIGLKKM
jgi:hypothetical protein